MLNQYFSPLKHITILFYLYYMTQFLVLVERLNSLTISILLKSLWKHPISSLCKYQFPYFPVCGCFSPMFTIYELSSLEIRNVHLNKRTSKISVSVIYTPLNLKPINWHHIFSSISKWPFQIMVVLNSTEWSRQLSRQREGW